MDPDWEIGKYSGNSGNELYKEKKKREEKVGNM